MLLKKSVLWDVRDRAEIAVLSILEKTIGQRTVGNLSCDRLKVDSNSSWQRSSVISVIDRSDWHYSGSQRVRRQSLGLIAVAGPRNCPWNEQQVSIHSG